MYDYQSLIMRRLRIFYSYAHEDRGLRDQLEKHLAALQREGLVESWSDRLILPGSEWDSAIDEQVRHADIILLLISVDFLASAYITGVELRCALDRAARQEAVVIPILLRPVEWGDSGLSRFQALPSDARPVTKWHNRDEAFVDIAEGIRRVVRGLLDVAPRPSTPENISADDRVQDRVLDAAMAAKIPMGKPADLAVMVRRVDAPGLKAVLEVEEEYSAEPEDVRSKTFEVEFPRDAAGRLASATLILKLEGPDFEPASQTKKIVVPPHGDSDVCTFFITPLFAGELVLNLEVYAGEGQQVSRLFRVLSESSDRVIVGGRRLVSVPISTSAGAMVAPKAVPAAPAAAATTASGAGATGLFRGPAAQAPERKPAASPLPRAPEPPAAPPASIRKAAARKAKYLPHAATAAAVVLLSGSAAYYLHYSGASPAPPAEATLAIAEAVSPPSAQRALPPAESSSPTGWQAQYERGVAAVRDGQAPAGVKDLEAAVAAAPTQAQPVAALAAGRIALSDRAPAAEKTAQLAQAQQEANRAVAMQPSARNYWIQGLALQRSGKLAEAETALRTSVKMDPSQADAWYALGVVLRDSNKTDDAAAALQKVIHLEPQNNDARLLLAATLARRDPAAAKNHVAKALGDRSLTGARLNAARGLAKELGASR